MIILEKGRYRARLAGSAEDFAALHALRAGAFAADRDGPDAHDAACAHMLIEDMAGGAVVGTFRLALFATGGAIGSSYSSQFYELSALSRHDAPMMELGRFCTAGRSGDPDILRVAWGAIVRRVEETGAQMIFGCTTFPTQDAGALEDAFALLRARHLAPPDWRPGIRAPEVVTFPDRDARDPKGAQARMPALLRSYLGMGGRVGDHAVIDRQMRAIHVFTGLEIAAIPKARVRLLRALAE
ncbi:GNAT family N-acetyltransferase [Palleronia sp. LCG004]|uniref:GNAT family N-acetyltransferase n=1 Tax=Palleronia sp. LCG004 TaxID=3079304 RepID=UPI002942ACDD|nr:GNAT family N-acyltransferase [Palleronia sp. LCG004]WOI54930.1 GNAT family N-acyltransferase [Palleronia sp. LCG004]